jgi:beta-galactosidase/beta-glucuronidase
MKTGWDVQLDSFKAGLGETRGSGPFAPTALARDKSALGARPRVAGKFLFLGGGVSCGAFRPDKAKHEYRHAAQIERDFAQMAAAGVNTVRIPHTVPPISLFDTALRHRLRVMVGLSAEQYVGYLLDPQKQAPDIKARIRGKVQTVKHHPALLCCSIGNEITASVARMLGRKTVERYLWQLYDVIKAEDPSAILTYVNYPSTEYLQLPFLDIVRFNVYLESTDRVRKYVARLHNIAADRPLTMTQALDRSFISNTRFSA